MTVGVFILAGVLVIVVGVLLLVLVRHLLVLFFGAVVRCHFLLVIVVVLGLHLRVVALLVRLGLGPQVF